MLNLKVGLPSTQGARNAILTAPGLSGHAVYGPYQSLPVGATQSISISLPQTDNDSMMMAFAPLSMLLRTLADLLQLLSR